MDRNTKTMVVAGAAGALVLAAAVGAAGTFAVTRALSAEEPRERLSERPGYHREMPRRFERGFGFGGFGHLGLLGGLDAAATYLEVGETELLEALGSGKTLAEVAEDEGKTVDGLVDALVAAATERLDEAVEDGRLSEERADDIEQKLEALVTDLVQGDLWGLPLGRPGFDFGPGGLDHDRRDPRGPRA